MDVQLSYSKKKRRTKAAEKTAEQREDELPWEIPVPFDPAFLPTSLYKSAFASPSARSKNIQTLLEPYYDFSKSKKTNYFNATFNKVINETSGCGSARASSPISPSQLATSREAAGSCPAMIAPNNNESPLGKTLPPIGVFWDIENCSIPRGRSALVAVQRIRDKFFLGHLEAEFVCVCDIRKEAPTVIQELNDAQVSVVHVAGNSKNAADDKLRQSMRRFADISCSNPVNSTWNHPATIVLISGDINFATDLCDLRYRKRLYVILLHNKQTPEALLLCAHEKYEFHSLLVDLPFRSGYRDFSENATSIPLKGGLCRADVLISDLPLCGNGTVRNFVRHRLRKLSENCGGKVLTIEGQSALIRFPNFEAAMRASKRMNGEDVIGCKISAVCYPNRQMELCGSSASYQIPPVNSELAQDQDNFKMKTSQGIYSGSGSTTWKPTWKRSNMPFDVLRQGSSRHRHHSADMNKYTHNLTTAQSNSSSPNESSSRDPSPNVLQSQGNIDATAGLSTFHHLNNTPQHPQAVAILNSLTSGKSGSSFAFHQNFYPNMDYAGANPNSNSESQAPQQSENADVAPRLYSTMTPGNIALTPSNHHNLSMHFERSMSKPVRGAGNGILIPQSALSPMSHNSAIVHDGSFMGPSCAVLPNVSGSFQRFRSNDGETYDLTVTNIDPAIGDWKAIRAALTTVFSEHVNVRGIWVSVAGDGSACATVRLSNKEDIHYAVAQLHRRRIGSKRIFISFDEGLSVDHDTLKKEVASLLQDVPNHTIPLFKFREMFEKRYKRSVSSSDLYRMKDVVIISESSGSLNGMTNTSSGRTISLTKDWKNIKDGKGLDLYCQIHPPKRRGTSEKSRMGWAEKEAEVMLPNVTIELKTLSARIHSLLQSHDSGFPLISFLDCYEAEFGPLGIAPEGRGVPLEHLITCVQGVAIVVCENGMKRVQWHERKDVEHGVNPTLATQLAQFGRELIDLLKTFPRCSLPFSKLIPSYHAHFGRQCRVADYGHFSLLALLQTLPHVVQIIGAAQNRVLTLSHRAQMKRFATDLLRVLKSQGGPKKQIRMSDFPAAFTNVFPNRQFQPQDYGLCCFHDLVGELVEHSTLIAVVKDEEGYTMLAVPKREQTPQEIHKTRIFAAEVVELLRHSTRCELEFSKFVPYYHHHFQKQCKVSDYGFSKLAELFDAISDTVLILNPSSTECSAEEKIIRLTPKEQIKVVGEQICNIIEKRRDDGLKTSVDELIDCFLEEHGFLLKPELCGADTLDELLLVKLENYVKVANGELILVDRVLMEDVMQKAEGLLQKVRGYTMQLTEFVSRMKDTFDVVVDENMIEKDLNPVLVLTTAEDGKRLVELSPIRVFAYEMTLLLEEHGGSVLLSALDSLYFDKFGQPLRPAQLGFPTVLPMLQAIPDVLYIRGKLRTKRTVVLNSYKSLFESSVSDDSSSSSVGKQTPRANSWRGKDLRLSGSGGKMGKVNNEWSANAANRRAPPPPPLFSPLASPVYHGRSAEANVFSFDRSNPLSPPMFDVWMQETVAPGSPPLSPPVVWTCHPIYYPSSPPPAGAGNILVTSPYVASATWSHAPVAANCISPGQASQPMIGNEFIFGQNQLDATFERLTVDTGNDN